GEHPLAVYCASVLLSFAGHAFLRMAWNNLLTQALVTLGGIVIMTGIAAKLAHLNQSRGSPAPI
ncbi:MAG: OpgC domain-containing protein, partial [Bradyrhizobium sp.]|nr:OpgC domain-containing protein [Bradyrhizobium sp.]